ncbi:MAG: HEPN domain-containing protein [bacterium]
MDKTIIDTLYEENQVLDEYLIRHDEISLRSNFDSNFRKTLLLSIASYFEYLIKNHILEFAEEQARAAEPLIEFLKNKAIERQYHTYFQWDARNANAFFGLFGSGFKDFMREEIAKDTELQASISAFVELGQVRNQLVHQNYATFPMDKTVQEIYDLYKKALLFVDAFPKKLRVYLNNINSKID